MSVEVKERGSGKLFEIHLSGKLVEQEYEVFVPTVQRLAKQHGKTSNPFAR